MASFYRRLYMSNRPNGVKQVKIKSLAYSTRLSLFCLSLIIWLESRTPKWRGSLGHRLCNFSYQCQTMGRRTKALVLRLCGLRSSPSSILAALEHKMATLENEKMDAVPACDWCRMGLHNKCDRLTKLHAVCVCNCERGY